MRELGPSESELELDGGRFSSTASDFGLGTGMLVGEPVNDVLGLSEILPEGDRVFAFRNGSRSRSGLVRPSSEAARFSERVGATGEPPGPGMDVRGLDRKPAWKWLGLGRGMEAASGTMREGLDSSAESSLR